MDHCSFSGRAGRDRAWRTGVAYFMVQERGTDGEDHCKQWPLKTTTKEMTYLSTHDEE